MLTFIIFFRFSPLCCQPLPDIAASAITLVTASRFRLFSPILLFTLSSRHLTTPPISLFHFH